MHLHEKKKSYKINLVTSSPESSNLIGQYRVYISHINL